MTYSQQSAIWKITAFNNLKTSFSSFFYIQLFFQVKCHFIAADPNISIPIMTNQFGIALLEAYFE